jgi:hypothetical protein
LPVPRGGNLILESRSWGGGAGGEKHRITYVEGSSRTLIFAGENGYPVRVFDAVDTGLYIIEYCGGSVDDVVSSTRLNSSGPPASARIRFQVIVQPGLSRGPVKFCTGPLGRHARTYNP